MNVINLGYDSANYYALATTHPVLLVDVGFPGTLGKLKHQCKRQGVELAHLHYLLATHYHPDHAGLASALQDEGITLIVLKNQIASVPVLQSYFKPPYQDNSIDLTRAILITNEESRAFLAKVGIQGEILHTPGHSDDSNTLLLDDGAAFTGDLPLPMMAGEAPFMQARASWQQLLARKASIIYPGHGPSWRVSERANML